MADLTALGARLRAARRRAGLTQSAAAERMGFSRYSTISDHERGTREVSEEILRRYAELYGVGAQALRYGGASVVRETSATHYALSDADIARVPGLEEVLRRMPPHAYAVAFPLLQMLEAVGASQEAQDRAEVFLTEVCFGGLTPDMPPRSDAEQVADVQAAVAMLFDMYRRRGIERHEVRSPAVEDVDPDAITGERFVEELQRRKRGPKAG